MHHKGISFQEADLINLDCDRVVEGSCVRVAVNL